MVPQEASDRKLQSLVRLRAGLVIVALVLPLALFLLFERQARRLDALAAHGEPVRAVVEAVSRDGSTTFYAYRVADTEHHWNVHRREAPFSVGQSFSATYLPEAPSFSRPIAERSLARKEAARNRSFAWKGVLGLGAFLALLVGLVQRDVHRLRRGRLPDPADPRAYKRRLALTSILFIPILVLIGGFHFRDAIERGESIVPVILGLLLSSALIGGTLFWAGREGPAGAQARAARLMRWVVPLAVAAALLRLIAMLLRK